jgi:hypothetical protein
MKNKASMTKSVEPPRPPVFQNKLHRLRPNPKAAITSPKSQQRDNILSKSPNPGEDRGSGQMKTTHDSQTFFRICGDFKP